jgi:hypothetical protein
MNVRNKKLLVFFTAILPSVACADDVLIYTFIGIPFAVISYLIFSVVYVFFASKSKRVVHILWCVILLPLCGLFYWGIFFELSHDLNLILWFFGLPSMLLLASCLIWLRHKLFKP